MATTIQVKEITKQRLDILKQKYAAASYDEVIMRMTESKIDTAKSMFGSLKGIGPWTKADKSWSRYD